MKDFKAAVIVLLSIIVLLMASVMVFELIVYLQYLRPETSGKAEVSQALTITKQPINMMGKLGDTVSLEVEASGGKAPLTYQWQYTEPDGTTFLNSTSDGNTTNVLHPPIEDMPYDYRCVITDADGSTITSDTARVLADEPVESPKNTEVVNLIEDFPNLYQLDGGDYKRIDDRIIAENFDRPDVALIRKVRVEPGEHVLIEVSAIVHKGNAFGIIFVENAYDDFSGPWFFLNADLVRKDSRLYSLRKSISPLGSLMAMYRDNDLKEEQEIRLALEILPDKTFRASYNGQEFTDDTVLCPDYTGGYPGLLTYHANVEFLSATLTRFID